MKTVTKESFLKRRQSSVRPEKIAQILKKTILGFQWLRQKKLKDVLKLELEQLSGHSKSDLSWSWWARPRQVQWSPSPEEGALS